MFLQRFHNEAISCVISVFMYTLRRVFPTLRKSIFLLTSCRWNKMQFTGITGLIELTDYGKIRLDELKFTIQMRATACSSLTLTKSSMSEFWKIPLLCVKVLFLLSSLQHSTVFLYVILLIWEVTKTLTVSCMSAYV